MTGSGSDIRRSAATTSRQTAMAAMAAWRLSDRPQPTFRYQFPFISFPLDSPNAR